MTKFIELNIEPYAIFPEWHPQHRPRGSVFVNVDAISTVHVKKFIQWDHSLREPNEKKNDFAIIYNDEKVQKNEVTVSVLTLLSTNSEGDSEVYQITETPKEIMNLIKDPYPRYFEKTNALPRFGRPQE